jgi:hypothetical protein
MSRTGQHSSILQTTSRRVVRANITHYALQTEQLLSNNIIDFQKYVCTSICSALNAIL